MSFPLEILRGARPPLRFIDEAALRAWLQDEVKAWAWLNDDSDWEQSKAKENEALRRRVADAQWAGLSELQGLVAEEAALDDALVAATKDALTRAYLEGAVPTRADAGVDAILDAAKINRAHALGMLAQALGIAVENESAAAFAGRQAWLAHQPTALAASIPERLADLNKKFADVEAELDKRRDAAAAKTPLAEFQRARKSNGIWVGGLAVIALLWIAGAIYGVYCIHRLTLPTSATPEWGPEVAERATLFLFLMTIFGWGMRWIGRMIQDAWAAGQSAAKRYTALKVVLDDEAARLVKSTEKDHDRIRAEIFGDTPGAGKSPDKTETKAKDDQETNDNLDVAKKVVALLKDMQSLVPGSGK